MSVMSNKKRNKKKKRLKKLLVMVLILFLMLGFAGIWLVHQKNESEKQQRKALHPLQERSQPVKSQRQLLQRA